MCISLLTAAVPVSYSREFLSILPANSGNRFEDTNHIYECHISQNKEQKISLNTPATSAFVTAMRCVFCEIQHLPNTKPH